MDPAMLDDIKHIAASQLEPFPTAGRVFLTDLLFKPRPAAGAIAAPVASTATCEMPHPTPTKPGTAT